MSSEEQVRSTDADRKSENLASPDPSRSRRFGRDALFCLLGLALGCVIGARWLSQTRSAQVLLGTTLPPVGYNWTFDGEVRKIRLGMNKGEVVAALSLQRVCVLTGESLKRWRPSQFETSVSIEETENKDRAAGLAEAVEVWFVPMTTMGATTFLYLAFDREQSLCWFGVDEFALGFSTRWFGIDELTEERP
jgi:hypothetical protein